MIRTEFSIFCLEECPNMLDKMGKFMFLKTIKMPQNFALHSKERTENTGV
jgi:hypothetical protein